MRKLVIGLLVMVLAQTAHAGTVIITSKPTKAEVVMEEKTIGKTPCRLSVPKGRRTVILRADGYDELVHEFEMGQQLVVLKLQLQLKTYSVDVVFKDITEDTTGWWAIHANKIIGAVPGTLALPKGKQRIALVKEGFRDITLTVPVAGTNQLVELVAPTRGLGSFRRIKPIVQLIGTWVQTPTDSEGERAFTFELDGKGALATPYRTYAFTWTLDARGEIVCCNKSHNKQYTLKLRAGKLVGKREGTMPGDWNLVKQ